MRTSQSFWSASLAGMDADGDGFSNGDELGDANGDGIAEQTTGITNPGDIGSHGGSGNDPPAFTSDPVLTAHVGEPFFYRATASDADGNNLVFSKSSGPTWLSVVAGGAASGTPPLGAAGSHTVTLKVTDMEHHRARTRRHSIWLSESRSPAGRILTFRQRPFCPFVDRMRIRMAIGFRIFRSMP